MIHGLEKFKEYFRGFEDQYVIIGGTACSILFNDFGTSFRSTKDIDMVLLVEVLTKEFGDKFISFVSEAGYEHMNNTAECPQYYRFSKPKKSEFPTMIELFSKSQENVLYRNLKGIIPIHIDDEVPSLSAILLNDSYYEMLKTGIEIIDGVSILTEKLLVLFKMKAWLDLKERKTKGESIDSDNIKKHKNDVFRLSQLILDTTPISLPKDVKTDVKNFCSQMLEEDVDLKSLNIKTTKEKILQKYKSLYNIE